MLGDLQERRIRPGISLIWRRYGGGVGNRETAAGNSTDAKSHREAALGVDELQPAVCFQGLKGQENLSLETMSKIEACLGI